MCVEQNGILASNLPLEWFDEILPLEDPGHGNSEFLRPYRNTWIGAERKGSVWSKEWKWITGESLPADHPRWDPDPWDQRLRDTGDCLTVYRSYGGDSPGELYSKAFLVMWRCDAKFYFFCEFH